MDIKLYKKIINEVEKCLCSRIFIFKKRGEKNVSFEFVEVNFENNNDVVKKIIKDSKIEDVESIEENYSETISNHLYKIDSEIIGDKLNSFIKALDNSSIDDKSDVKNMNGIVYKCSINLENETKNILFITVYGGLLKTYKNIYILDGNEFKELLRKRTLTLRDHIDIMIFNDEVYVFDIDLANSLFDLDKQYVKKQKESLEEIKKIGLIDEGFEILDALSQTKHYPRMFTAFKSDRLNKLKDPKIIKEISSKFNIKTNSSKTRLTLESDEDAEKLIKLLCGKGMLDPFNQNAMEVVSSKEWKK